jgi:hypothetical protein
VPARLPGGLRVPKMSLFNWQSCCTEDLGISGWNLLCLPSWFTYQWDQSPGQGQGQRPSWAAPPQSCPSQSQYETATAQATLMHPA